MSIGTELKGLYVTIIQEKTPKSDTKMKLESLNEWTHVPVPASPEEVSGLDGALRTVVSRQEGQCDGTVSFVFHRTVKSTDGESHA